MPSDWERIPEPLGILFGAQLGWSPERESQPMDTRCRTCGGSIKTGSRLYCAACTRTGYESRIQSSLARERAQKPKRDKAPKFRPKIRLTQKDVRAIARTAEGRAWLAEIGRLDDEPDNHAE